MSETQIDEIRIQIVGDSKDATSNIQDVIAKLNNLKSAIAAFNHADGEKAGRTLTSVSVGLSKLAEASQNINAKGITSIAQFANALKRFESLSDVSGTVEKLGSALRTLSSQNYNFSKEAVSGMKAVTGIVNSFAKVDSKDFSGSVESITNGLENIAKATQGFNSEEATKGMTAMAGVMRAMSSASGVDPAKMAQLAQAVYNIGLAGQTMQMSERSISGANAMRGFISAVTNTDLSKFAAASSGIRGLLMESRGMGGITEQSLTGLKTLSTFIGRFSKASADNMATIARGMHDLVRETQAINNIDADKLRSFADALKYAAAAYKARNAGMKNTNAQGQFLLPGPTTADAGTVKTEATKASADTSGLEEEAQAIERVGRGAAIAEAALRLLGGAFNILTTVASGYGSVLKRVVSGTASLAASLYKAVSPTYALVHGITSVSARMRQMMSDFGRILKYRMIRSAIRLITSSFTEGIKNAYQYAVQTGNQFQATMDNLATSALYVKNSLGAMAMPLLNQLAPAIDYIADKFVQLINLINHFFAVISGASTWTRALKYPVKFNNGVASSASGAKKAADELKATILGLDELNLLNDQNDPKSGSGGGGGASAQDYGAMFETVDVGTSALANTLKDLFRPFKLAWENEGQATLDAMSYAFDSVKSLIGTIAQDFKDMWTGGTGQEIVESILRAWQGVYTTIGNIASNLETAWSENGRGKRIVEAIGGIVSDIAGFVEDIATSTAEWAEDLDFGNLLDSVGELAEKFRDFASVLEDKFKWVWDNILLPFAGWAIDEGLPLVIDALGTAFDTAGDLIEKAWPGIETALSVIEDLAVDSFEKFVDAFTEFCDALDSLTSMDLKGTFKHLGDGLGDLATNPLVLALIGKSAGKSLLSLLAGNGGSSAAVGGAAASTGGATTGGLLGSLTTSQVIGGALGAAGHFASTNLLPWLMTQSAGEAATKAAIELEVTGANNTSKSMLEFFASKKPKKDVTVNGKGTEDDTLKGIRSIFSKTKKTIELGYKTDSSRNTWNVKEWFDTKTRSFFNWLGYKSDGTEKTSVFTTWKNLAGRVIKNILGYNSDGTERTNWFRQWLTVAGRTIKNWLGYNMDGSENSNDTKTWLGAKAKTARATLGYTMDGSQNNSNVTTWRNTSSSRSTFWKTLGFKTDGSESNKNVLKWINTESSTISKTLQMNLKLKVEAIAAGKSASSGNTQAVSILDQRLLFAQGGFPASGSVFVANENGPEYVGKFGSGTAVANNDQIVEGITAGVANANSEQNRLLREQNELLRAILDKDNGGSSVSASDVLRALSQTNRRTGHPVVAMN